MNTPPTACAAIGRDADVESLDRATVALDGFLEAFVPLVSHITGRAGLQAFIAGRVLRAQIKLLGPLP